MERKKEIIYAALELASERGPGAVSMQQIADRVGITKASLYNHYSSKDQIIEAMYDYLREASTTGTCLEVNPENRTQLKGSLHS